MKTELIDHSPTRKELHIEIDAEEVRKQLNTVTDRYMKFATVPGFRPGRAPQTVVRQRYKDEIRSEVVRDIVPQALQQAIEEENLRVIGEPDVQLADEEGLLKIGDVPLAIRAGVEVYPDFEVKDYKGVQVARRVRPVTDADVEQVIESLREANASLIPIEDRGAQAGDTVSVNFRGRYTDDPEAEEIKADEVDVEIGGEGVLPQFDEALTGTRAEDERTFTIAYPEDFSSKGLAGKTIEYTAKVLAVRRKELPEVDDEFVIGLGEAEVSTPDALRTRVRETLEANARAESDAMVQGNIVDQLIKSNEIEVPASFVQMQTRSLLEQTVRDMYNRGIDPRAGELDWANMRGSLEQQAISDLRGSMILERIAEEEAIEVSEEEVEAELQRIAGASRKSVEEVRASLTKQGGDRSIADRLRNRKALDLLTANAQITDEKWREEEPEEETEAAVAQAEPTADASAEAAPETGEAATQG